MNNLSGAIARELQAVMLGQKKGMKLRELVTLCADELSNRQTVEGDETDRKVLGCWTEGTASSAEIEDWTA